MIKSVINPTSIYKNFERLDGLIGNTSLHKLNFGYGNLYTKLEYQNFFGSIKDRSAYYILKNALHQGHIDPNTTVIESSSGNFAIAISGICKSLGIKFIPVIDSNICTEKENILKLHGNEIIKITERDETGGYLLNRIKAVKEFVNENPNVYNPNQYENPDNCMAYYHTLGNEICDSFSHLDYAFISVSTGGTIAGLSNRLKEKFKGIKIIGVDVEGSLVFRDTPKIRKITGLGSSMRSVMFDQARIDDHIVLSQIEIIEGCRNLLAQHNLFLGASSGAAYVAASRVLKVHGNESTNALFISSDSGYAYLNTIYNSKWVEDHIS